MFPTLFLSLAWVFGVILGRGVVLVVSSTCSGRGLLLVEFLCCGVCDITIVCCLHCFFHLVLGL